MRPYPKIETLLNRDPKTHRVMEGAWRLPEFYYLAGNNWYFTEKVDGTNIRVIWDGAKIEFRGRTDKATIPPFLLKKLETLFTTDKMRNVFDGPACLYGEGYGARIQKRGADYIPDGVDFVLFDVLIGNYWLRRNDLEDVADKLQIKVVPVVGIGSLYDAIETAREGFTSKWGPFTAEGLVVKPLVQLLKRDGSRIIGKIKHRDF